MLGTEAVEPASMAKADLKMRLEGFDRSTFTAMATGQVINSIGLYPNHSLRAAWGFFVRPQVGLVLTALDCPPWLP